MLGLDDYGSDVESDASDSSKQTAKTSTLTSQAKPKSSLSSLLPPAKRGSSIALPPPANAPSPSPGGLNLPPPTKSKKRDGPIKITVAALKPAEDEDADEPQVKKRRLDTDGEKKVGAGSSSLLNMLPAPKKAAPEKPAEQPKVLGGGGRGQDVSVAEAPTMIGATQAAIEEDDPKLAFLPPHLRKPRTTPAPSLSKPLGSGLPTYQAAGASSSSGPSRTAAPKLPEPEEDFFSLGSKPSSSKPSASSSTTASISISRPSALSAAPQVKEYEPPPPTPFDPYPGYYQNPNGEWAAYDPGYYKKYWESWQAEYSERGKGRDGKGWEGVENEDMVDVNAVEELKKSQLAEREKAKGLTAKPATVVAPPPTIALQKSGTVARSRHQLSTLLQEAYSNRAVIEEKLAEGRRNRKEAGNKYGF
ncbi:hypothetical protein M407DRAFT_13899 [Tulasnella calospora MUT 4182]|uniref:Mitotic checkpoint regulator, MAD2B-interacting-domain-containing protein n=1 Tax=Tulasnella calospora MUT 4182 TaxID=1051891 RepID=A0A0C3QJI3_9AGAM|nr:hypothetical protein M407DRAFT_13899 [Tulasnella calospora MUT 4182]